MRAGAPASEGGLSKFEQECDAMEADTFPVDRSEIPMRDLKQELASLHIERDEPRRGRWRSVLLTLMIIAAVIAGGAYFAKDHPVFGGVEVETVQSTVESGSGPNAGTPILTASGYLVARRQSVVSSKIQGRISRLLVEEGSIVKTGD